MIRKLGVDIDYIKDFVCLRCSRQERTLTPPYFQVYSRELDRLDSGGKGQKRHTDGDAVVPSPPLLPSWQVLSLNQYRIHTNYGVTFNPLIFSAADGTSFVQYFPSQQKVFILS